MLHCTWCELVAHVHACHRKITEPVSVGCFSIYKLFILLIVNQVNGCIMLQRSSLFSLAYIRDCMLKCRLKVQKWDIVIYLFAEFTCRGLLLLLGPTGTKPSSHLCYMSY